MLILFFCNDTATTEIYTLSLHDALPISRLARGHERAVGLPLRGIRRAGGKEDPNPDRKSTRLNSSHANISYAVFCLKKKKRLTSYWRADGNQTGRYTNWNTMTDCDTHSL